MTRRAFNHSERQALRRLYGDRCALCGCEVDDSTAQADHIKPHAHGGATELANAQLLCPSCNRIKGTTETPAPEFTVAKPPPRLKLRRWQGEFVADALGHIEAGGRMYMAAAGVGSGKTIAALSLYVRGPFDLVIVLAPKAGIRKSWQDDAAAMGLDLRPVLEGGRIADAPGSRTLPHGFVLTNAMLRSVLHDLAAYCAVGLRVLLVADEAHHLGDGMEWARHADAFSEHVSFTLGLSGTPTRDDARRIVTMTYETTTGGVEGVPCYSYSYEQALAEGHVAPVTHRFMAGSVEREHPSGLREVFDYRDGDYSERTGSPDEARMGDRLRLTAVESFDWQLAGIAAARAELMKMGKPWGGLIVCREVAQARRIIDEITGRWGDECVPIFAAVDTETAVAEFNAGTQPWAVSITKVSEGVNIDRLRVGVLLTNVTARTTYEQIRGRLVRVLAGVPHTKQPALFFVPKDPRIREYATHANELMRHSIPWLQRMAEGDADEAQREYERTVDEDTDHGATVEDMRDILDALDIEQSEAATVHVGNYRLIARPELDGGVVGTAEVSEAEWHELRRRMAPKIGPDAAIRATPQALRKLERLT